MSLNNLDEHASLFDQSNLKKRRLLSQSEEPETLLAKRDFMNGSHFSEEIDSYCLSIGSALANMTPRRRSSAMIRMNQLLIFADNELEFKEVGYQTTYKHVLVLGELPERALRFVLSLLAVVDLLRLRAVDSNFRNLVDSVFRSQLVMLNISYANRFKGGDLKQYKMTSIPPSVGSKVRSLWMDRIDGDTLINGGCCSDLVELRVCPEDPFIAFNSGFLSCQQFLRFEKLETFWGKLLASDDDIAGVDIVLTRLRRCKLLERLQLSDGMLQALLKIEISGNPLDCVKELVLPSVELLTSTKLFELFPSCKGFTVSKKVTSLEFLQFLPSDLRKLSLAKCSVVFDKSDLCSLSSLHNLVEFSFEQVGDVSSFPDFIFLTSFCELQNFQMDSIFFTAQDFAYIPPMAPLQRVIVVGNLTDEAESPLLDRSSLKELHTGVAPQLCFVDEDLAWEPQTILEQLLSRRESCTKLAHVHLAEYNDPDVVCQLIELHRDTLEEVSAPTLGGQPGLDSVLGAVTDRLSARLGFFNLAMSRDNVASLAALIDFVERRARLYRDPTVSFAVTALEFIIVDCLLEQMVEDYLDGLGQKAHIYFSF